MRDMPAKNSVHRTALHFLPAIGFLSVLTMKEDLIVDEKNI